MRALLSILGLLAAGVAYEFLGASADRRRFRSPGRVIDIGSCRLYLHEQGSGQPAVLLEAGLAATSLSWAYVQPEAAKFTSAFSYDRAGLGWSSVRPGARTVQAMTAELKELLHRADVQGPFILVGHSFGGLLIRAFAALNPRDVAGLIFVDPVSLCYWAECSPGEKRKLAVGAKLSRRGAWLARLGIVRLTLAAFAAGGRRFPQLVARTAAGPGTALLNRLVGEIRKLPPEVLPVVRAHWSRPKAFTAMAATLQALPENAQTALQMPIPPHIPFTVLSASSATEQELEERDAWVHQHPGGQHIRLSQCGHWLPLEQPGAIVSAIHEMVEQVRSVNGQR